MNILVTGGTGYIGSCLVKRLVNQGHAVTVVILKGTGTEALQSYADKVDICIYDGSMESLTQGVTRARPDVAIHVASLFLVHHKPQDVDTLVASNILFPTQLLEVLDAQGCRKLINVGTSWQHYNDAPYSPVNLYAATKQAFADMMAFYVEARGFKAITLKLFDTYGPGDMRPKLFTLLRRTAREGSLLKMSPGEQTLDLVFIEDILDAFEMACKRLDVIAASETFGICTQHPIRLRDLASLYAKIVGKKLNIEWGGTPYRPREVMTTWKAYALIPGWQARTSLHDGIVAMEHDPNINGLLAVQDNESLA